MEKESENTYVKLGIGIGEVYEIKDLPEDDQYLASKVFVDIPKSEFIESNHINALEAFKVFSGKILNSINADFSDNISVSKVGFSVQDVDTNSSEADISLESKYLKAQRALKNLTEEIKILKESEKDGGESEISTVNMVKKIDYLQNELLNLSVEHQNIQVQDMMSGDQKNRLQRRLLIDLENFEKKTPKLHSIDKSSIDVNDKEIIQYKIYCITNKANHDNMALIADLEQRIERCEAVLGVNPEKLAALTSEISNKTIMGALSHLVAKFSILDIKQMTYFESSLLAIQQKILNNLNKTEPLEVSDKIDMISRVHEVIKKNHHLFEKLPNLIRNLESLNEIQTSALQFSQTLTYLNDSQKQIISQIQNYSNQLKQIQALNGPQMNQFETNFKLLEEDLKQI